MTPNRSGSIVALFAFLLLAALIYAYHGDAAQLLAVGQSGGDYPPPPTSTPDHGSYPDPYPDQYLPAIVNMPAPSAVPPTQPPPATLHVGLQVRWDGTGTVFIDGYTWRPGTHLTRIVDQQIDGDTVRVSADHWYSPNPFGWESQSWVCHYNNVSNLSEGCTGTSDPAWKWDNPWIMPAGFPFASGRNATIDGQVFTVTGPHSFQLGNGETANFWRLVNRDRFLLHADGGEWTQYVEVGDALLYYEVDSGMLLYESVKRTWYRNGNWTPDTVRYEQLISIRAGRAADAPQPEATPEEVHLETTLTTEEALGLLAGLGIDPTSLAP